MLKKRFRKKQDRENLEQKILKKYNLLWKDIYKKQNLESEYKKVVYISIEYYLYILKKGYREKKSLQVLNLLYFFLIKLN